MEDTISGTLGVGVVGEVGEVVVWEVEGVLGEVVVAMSTFYVAHN